MKKMLMVLALSLVVGTAFAAEPVAESVEPMSQASAEAPTETCNRVSSDEMLVRTPTLSEALGLEQVIVTETAETTKLPAGVEAAASCGKSYCTYTGRTKCYSSSMCSSNLLLHRERACANLCVQWYDYVSTPICC